MLEWTSMAVSMRRRVRSNNLYAANNHQYMAYI
jgi:hypothetical protein